MRGMIVLIMILVVFAFATTIAATISTLKIDMLGRTLSFRNVNPLGDPIDGGPPGLVEDHLGETPRR